MSALQPHAVREGSASIDGNAKVAAAAGGRHGLMTLARLPSQLRGLEVNASQGFPSSSLSPPAFLRGLEVNASQGFPSSSLSPPAFSRGQPPERRSSLSPNSLRPAHVPARPQRPRQSSAPSLARSGTPQTPCESPESARDECTPSPQIPALERILPIAADHPCRPHR